MTTEEMQALRTMMEEVVAPIKEDVKELKDGLHKTNLILENEIRPAIQLLAEGQQNILEHIDEKVTSKYEELDNRVTALETAYKELKRAQ